MLRVAGGVLFLGLGLAGVAAETDFGIRQLGKSPNKSASASSEPLPAGTWGMEQPSGRPIDMGDIRQIGGRWGQVTSTYRSAAHNRRVGGVANSYHLSNRAIDI